MGFRSTGSYMPATMAPERSSVAPITVFAVAQELGVEADPEILAHRLAGCALDLREHDPQRRARRDRAAHHDDVEPVLARQSLADRAGRCDDRGIVAAAILRGRRADGDEGHVRPCDSRRQIVRGRHQSVGDAGREEFPQLRLVNGRVAARDRLNLVAGDVHADDAMAERGQARRRDRTDIAEPDDADGRKLTRTLDARRRSPVLLDNGSGRAAHLEFGRELEVLQRLANSQIASHGSIPFSSNRGAPRTGLRRYEKPPGRSFPRKSRIGSKGQPDYPSG